MTTRDTGLEHLYREFAETYLKVESQSGDEWSVLCPVHGDNTASMRFNIVKGVFFCHACGAKGTCAALARFLHVPFSGASNYRDAETQMSILRAKLALLTKEPTDLDEPEYWPERRLERFKAIPTTYWSDPLPLGRGFTQATIEAFDLGYDPMANHAIIPIRDTYGRILGVTRRDLDPKAKPRYLDPKGFVKGEHLYGAGLVRQSNKHYAAITEGPLDAAKVWQAGHPTLAQFGSKLTLRQIKLLKELGVTVVILFYDNDEAGEQAAQYALGWRRAIGRSGKLEWIYLPEGDLRNFFVVKRVNYGDTLGKDPGELEDGQIDSLVCNAEYIGYTRG